MGMYLLMRTENLETDDLFSGSNYLDRTFQGLESGKIVSVKAIKEVYGIDLSPIMMVNYKDIDSAVDEWKDYEDYRLKSIKDKVEIAKNKKKLAIEYEKAKEREKLEYETSWSDIFECNKLVETFIKALKENPELLPKLVNSYFQRNAAYFDINSSLSEERNILGDLNRMIKFMDYSIQNGAKKFALFYS